MTQAPAHIPVLLESMLAAMAPAAEEVYLDGTFGAGGYSRALLQAQARCRVVALDRDPSVRALAERLAQEFPGRFVFLAGCFSQMAELLAAQGIASVQGVVLDIGVSSMQIDTAGRGFSFGKDGPLDMRMSGDGVSAADIVNGWEEEVLADLLFHYGEERASRRIARAIVQARAQTRIETTAQLAAVIRSVVRPQGRIDPATRSFQALRIEVNDELGELQRGLLAAEQVLAPGGRLVVVTFHSLEDRIVKHFLIERSGEITGGSRHLPPVAGPARAASFTLRSRKSVAASDDEAARNPRARSAKLRAAVRTDAAAWPAPGADAVWGRV